MSNLLAIAVAIIVLFAIILAAFYVGRFVEGLLRRMAKLEEAQARHLPYVAADETENAAACVNYRLFDIDADRQRHLSEVRKLDAEEQDLRVTLGHILKARNGKEGK